MYQDSLLKIGLNYYQAVVYETLLKEGALTAGKISQKTPIKRGLVYKILDELVAEDLVEKDEPPQKVAVFSAGHPTKLRAFAERKEQSARDAKLALEGVLPSIVSDFSALSGKPGVLYYEGENGIAEILEDSLTSKTEILTYADAETIIKYIKKINDSYVQKRKQAGIKKRLILLDNDFTRAYARNNKDELTETRFIDHEMYQFSSLAEIYDGTVSYVSLSEKQKSGFVIKNPEIYRMQKSLFEFIWGKAKTIVREVE
jgi:sugar-specific transcriptional regulator TrmB